MIRIAVAQGSLTEGDCVVLVNASNTNLDLGSGVSAAIRRACGPGYQEHIHRRLAEERGGPLAPGEVLVTDAGGHPRARWVAHVAVMDYRPGSAGPVAPDLARIERGCENLWRALEGLASEASLTVAMVALGAGVGGLGVRASTAVAAETLRRFDAATPGSRIAEVRFFGFMLPDVLVMSEVLGV